MCVVGVEDWCEDCVDVFLCVVFDLLYVFELVCVEVGSGCGLG